MPSKEYRRALKQATAHHARSKTYSGLFLRPHKPFLSELIERLGIASALDYGSGKGLQYEWIDPEDGKTLEQAWGFEVAKFDPAWPPYAVEPAGPFDLVICTHVLGSIPLKDFEWVIPHLFNTATKAVFIAEKFGTLKKQVFGDRTGMPIFDNSNEWLDAIGAHRPDRPDVEFHFSGLVRMPDGQKEIERFIL